MSTFQVNLRDVIYSLSDALDLVGVTHIHHGKRVAFMAVECARVLGWPAERLDRLYQAGMLHDCGVSRTYIHRRLTQFEWEGEGEHCRVGAALLRSCPPLAPLADIVLHHHTHWRELQGLALSEEVRLAANCIYLVDRCDILTLGALKDQSNILYGREETRRAIADRRGDWFCPELVDAFLQASGSEAFWFSLESDQVRSYAGDWIAHDRVREVPFEELRSLVRIFSVIVDAKSPFTREHSEGVARVSRALGQRLGLSERRCEMLELAGLLHDLGKLRVPDELLEKPGRLTPEEYAVMKRHSFDTYTILRTIHGLEEVALWAAQHHERVDGSGYPYHLGEGLSIEARIVAVADVFQALVQNRPYRPGLSSAEVMAIVHEHVAGGRLDGHVVVELDAALPSLWALATGVADMPGV
ncbi:MAG: HD domain-containing protein [Curvibacter sp.]|nr:HD domain-containing protein [Curvibacter sp.]